MTDLRLEAIPNWASYDELADVMWIKLENGTKVGVAPSNSSKRFMVIISQGIENLNYLYVHKTCGAFEVTPYESVLPVSNTDLPTMPTVVVAKSSGLESEADWEDGSGGSVRQGILSRDGDILQRYKDWFASGLDTDYCTCEWCMLYDLGH